MIEVVEGAVDQLRRKRNRPTTPLGVPQKLPYLALSRIAELQALKKPKWDPRRLIRMLQELNLAHANGMDMATAMLVRTVTDHVPPLFGMTKFVDGAARHSAGSIDGRSEAIAAITCAIHSLVFSASIQRRTHTN